MTNYCDMTTKEFYEALGARTPDCKEFSYDPETNNIEYVDRHTDHVLLVTLDSEIVKVKDKYRELIIYDNTLDQDIREISRWLTHCLHPRSYSWKCVKLKVPYKAVNPTRDKIREYINVKSSVDMNAKELYKRLRNLHLTYIHEMTYDAENDNLQFTDGTTDVILLVTVGNNVIKVKEDYDVLHGLSNAPSFRFKDILGLLTDLIGAERYTCKCVKRKPTAKSLIGTDTPVIDIAESLLDTDDKKDAMKKYFTNLIKEMANDMLDKTTCEFSGLDRQLESLIRGYNVGVEESKRIKLEYDEGLIVTTDLGKYRISLTRDFLLCELNDPELDYVRKLAEMLGELRCIPFTPQVVVKAVTEVDEELEVTMNNDEVIDTSPVRKLPKGPVITVPGDDPDVLWHYRKIDIPEHVVSKLTVILNPVTEKICRDSPESIHYRLGDVVLVKYPDGYGWHRIDSLPAQLGHGNSPEAQAELPELYEGLEDLVDDGRGHVDTHLPDEVEHYTTDAAEPLTASESKPVEFKIEFNDLSTYFDDIDPAKIFDEWVVKAKVDTEIKPRDEDNEGFTWNVNVALDLGTTPGYVPEGNFSKAECTKNITCHITLFDCIKPDGLYVEIRVNGEIYKIHELIALGEDIKAAILHPSHLTELPEGLNDKVSKGMLHWLNFYTSDTNNWIAVDRLYGTLYLITKDSNG